MSWIYNARTIRDVVFSEITKQEAEILRFECGIVKDLEYFRRIDVRNSVTTYQKLTGYIIRETDKAIRFDVVCLDHPLDGEQFWFPLSQINYIKRAHVEDMDEIEVADWLVETKANELGKS